jgi:hypothetical protein
MDCHDVGLHLDDFLDGRLDAARQQALREHLRLCVACRRRHDHAAALLAAVRTLPAPPAPAGLADRLLAPGARRAAAGAPRFRNRIVALALAATLALGVALGVFFAGQPTPLPTASVALELERPETVRLVLNSAQPLRGVTLTLTLPENVELIGYAGRRELAWQTDLAPGANLLQLPLVAHGTPRGELVARLSQGERGRAVRVRIQVKPPGGIS